MKLNFSTITIDGFGETPYLMNNLINFDANVEYAITKVPRSDYSKFISNFQDTKLRSILLTISSDNETTHKQRKDLVNSFAGNIYTFTLIDDNSDGSTYRTYEFEALIIGVNTQQEQQSSFTQYLTQYNLQLLFEDPFLYDINKFTSSSSISEPSGLHFPLHFPLQFDDGGASVNITNNGDVDGFVTSTITGAGTGFTIRNETLNQDFEYSGTIISSDTVEITPFPYDPIKVRDSSGNSVLANTNFNFAGFLIPKGQTNTFRLTAASGTDGNANITLNFRTPYKGIT